MVSRSAKQTTTKKWIWILLLVLFIVATSLVDSVRGDSAEVDVNGNIAEEEAAVGDMDGEDVEEEEDSDDEDSGDEDSDDELSCSCEELEELTAEKEAVEEELTKTKSELTTMKGEKRIMDRYVERLELDSQRFKNESLAASQEVVVTKAQSAQQLQDAQKEVLLLKKQLEMAQQQIDEVSQVSVFKQLQKEVTGLWMRLTGQAQEIWVSLKSKLSDEKKEGDKSKK